MKYRRLSVAVIMSLMLAGSLRADTMRDWSLRAKLLEGASPGAMMKMRVPDGITHASSRWRIRATSTGTFEGFVHCPAELGDVCTNPFGSIFMTNNTAFYRDVIVGALTFVSGATDGESWSAVFTDPNGTALNFSGFTFHSTFNGMSNCFVSPFEYLCGTTSIEILWYMQSQCAVTGTWQAQFTNTAIPTQTFELKPQIDADTYLPLQLQGSYPNAPSGNPAAPYTSAPNPYDETCRRNILNDQTVQHCALADPVPAGFVRWSISAKGCYMTDVAMILTYHGFALTPKTLNDILVGIRHPNGDPLGFAPDGGVNPDAAARYATSHGTHIDYPIQGTGQGLSRDICTFGPQLVRVPKNLRAQHWVTAYGVKKDGTILVRDPANRFTTLPSVIATRRFSGKKYNFVDQITGMRFSFYSPVEAYVTDPMGRRVGIDPATGTTFDEIPNAFYDNDAGEMDNEADLPDPNPRKTLELFGDVDGDYTLTVTGTGTGTYNADIYAVDASQNVPSITIKDVPTSLNQVQTYVVHFDHTNAANVDFTGGFDGGGQRPRDVNKFLTYANPSSSSTTLPAGTTSYPLIIFYSTAMLPATFNATLNGVDITSQFAPAPGTMQIVSLSLSSGRNVLKLSTDGQLPSRVATDSDRLVLQVP